MTATTFLGIDGGGTHTSAVAVDRFGNVLARAQAGGLNFLGTNLDAVRGGLRSLLRALASQLSPPAEVHRTVIGCSALFSAATPDEQRILCEGILPLDKVRVVSDVDAAWFGATLGRAGVLVVAGTGSIVLAGRGRGRLVRMGGWGHLLGDEGSAYWIAREAIRAAVAAGEGRGPATRLGAWVRRGLGGRRLTDLVSIIYDPEFGKDRLAALCGFLSTSAARKDPVFLRICRQAGVELAMQALAAARRAGLGSGPIPVHGVGGVLGKDGPVRRSFLRALKARAQVTLLPAAMPPELGAAAMALRDGDVALTPEIIANLAAGGA